MGCQLLFSVPDSEVFDGQNVVARSGDFLQPEIPAMFLARYSIYPFKTFEHVAAGLSLLGFLALEVSSGKFLRLCDHRTLVFVFALLLFSLKLALDQKRGIVSFVRNGAAVFDLEDPV